MTEQRKNSPRAEKFLERLHAAYDTEHMSPSDHEYVAEVVFALNMLTELRAEIAENGLTEVRTGGRRMTPQAVESRLLSQHLTALLRNFPDIEDDDE